MEIRALTHQDTPACVALMQLLSQRGEILYKPVTEDDFNNRFFGECRWGFGAFENGVLIGFAHASGKTSFLNGENAANTPLYLTIVLVHPDHRLKGVGTALIDQVKALRKELGKPSVTVTDMNPVRLTWLIPGANGHDHNNDVQNLVFVVDEGVRADADGGCDLLHPFRAFGHSLHGDEVERRKGQRQNSGKQNQNDDQIHCDTPFPANLRRGYSLSE